MAASLVLRRYHDDTAGLRSSLAGHTLLFVSSPGHDSRVVRTNLSSSTRSNTSTSQGGYDVDRLFHFPVEVATGTGGC